jgi:hypothetical protein
LKKIRTGTAVLRWIRFAPPFGRQRHHGAAQSRQGLGADLEIGPELQAFVIASFLQKTGVHVPATL